MMRGGAFDPQEVEDFISTLVPEPSGWDDLRFPSQGINPPGAASDPTRSTTTGLLVFSGTQDNIIAGVAQMPHSWMSGSAIYPHLHLRFPTSDAGNTRWKMEYDVASISGAFTNNSGTYTTLNTITAPNAQNVKTHALAMFGPLTMTGQTSSAVIVWKVTRLASSDAADNDTTDCELLELDFHYQIDKFGTVTQSPE